MTMKIIVLILKFINKRKTGDFINKKISIKNASNFIKRKFFHVLFIEYTEKVCM